MKRLELRDGSSLNESPPFNEADVSVRHASRCISSVGRTFVLGSPYLIHVAALHRLVGIARDLGEFRVCSAS